MDVTMVEPWMLCAQIALDHNGPYYASHPPAPTPHPPWSQNASDDRRHHGWVVDALGSERIRPWVSSWLALLRTHQTDALLSPPQHCFQASAPVSDTRWFLARASF